ncbi:MAG: TonB-dependent receptor [Burkholderiales bacterium]
MRTRYLPIQLILVGLIASSTRAGAQTLRTDVDPLAQPQEVQSLDTEVITAYRVPIELRETTQGVSIINEKEIAVRNPASAIDLLQQLPGVQVDRVGNASGLSSIYIRGSEANHVLVLIDGVRVSDPTNTRGGGFDFSALDPHSVERIEVIRGAGSALYGADALGGIINIVTKRGKADGLHGSISGALGGQGYRQAQGSLSGGSQTIQYRLNASLLKDGKKSDGGDLDLASFSGSLAFQPTDKTDIRVYARRNDRKSNEFPEFSGGVLFAENRTLEIRDATESIYGVDAAYDPVDAVQLNLKLGRFTRLEDKHTPQIPFGPGAPNFVPDTTTHVDLVRDSTLISADVKLPWDSNLTLGLEHLREIGENKGVLIIPGFFLSPPLPFDVPSPTDFDLTRTTTSPFVELKIKPLDQLVLLLGLRSDSIRDAGSKANAFGGAPISISTKHSATSPSAGVRYTFSGSQTTIKGNYAEGFKPPSFFALGDPNVGDATLKPEKSQTAEVGLEQGFWGKRGMFMVSLFRTRLRDLIDFVDGRLQNVSNVKSDGVETALRLQPLDKLSLAINYTYNDLKNAATGSPLKSRPRHRAGLSVNYALTEVWQIGLNASYVGKVFDQAIPTGDRYLDPFTLVDVALSYQWKQLTATFAIDNLLNDKYQQFIGFENPGIRARAGIGYSF